MTRAARVASSENIPEIAPLFQVHGHDEEDLTTETTENTEKNTEMGTGSYSY